MLTIINKDVSRDADVSIAAPEHPTLTEALRLIGPSFQSNDVVALGCAAFTADGKWKACRRYMLLDHRSTALPHSEFVVRIPSRPKIRKSCCNVGGHPAKPGCGSRDGVAHTGVTQLVVRGKRDDVSGVKPLGPVIFFPIHH